MERSITGELLAEELTKVFTAAGAPPKLLRLDNGSEMVSQALQRFCQKRPERSTSRPAARATTATSNRSNDKVSNLCLNHNRRNTLLEARVVIGDSNHERNHQHRHSARGLPHAADYAAACRRTQTPGDLPHHPKMDQTNPTREPGGLRSGDSPWWLASSPLTFGVGALLVSSNSCPSHARESRDRNTLATP